MSGHDLAREPGLGEQRDHRLGEMPLPVQPSQPLIGAKRLRDGPGPEVLATMNSSEASRDTRPRTSAQELCASRGPEAPQQTPRSALNPRNTIPDPSDTYLARQFQESFNQVARTTMDEINRTTGRTLGRVVPSQRFDRSSSSSERAPRSVVLTGTAHDGTMQRSRVVDIRKNLTVLNQFVQVATEHPRACLNGMSWNPAISKEAIPSGSRHLVIGEV